MRMGARNMKQWMIWGAVWLALFAAMMGGMYFITTL